MKAVILAAGMGSRIRDVTNGVPKCLLRFAHRTILDCQIESLLRCGVSEIGIVMGYRAEDIAEAVRGVQDSRGVSIELFLNDEFATTNNMYSLALAREWVEDEAFLCLNADVVCHPALPGLLLEPGDDAQILVDPEYRDETTKVAVKNGVVTALSKTIPRNEAAGTFVNIASFSSPFAARLFDEATRQFAAGQRNRFFNDVLVDLIDGGLTVRPVSSGGLPWAEIDDESDFRYAREHMVPKILGALDEPADRREAAA